MAKDHMEKVRVVIDAAALERLRPIRAVEPLWWSIDPAMPLTEYEAAFAPYTRRQRLVYAMCWHGAEVGNGGHDQFFWNSTGVVWKDALEGYREAGIEDVAQLLQEAAARLGGDPPLEKVPRCELMQSLEPSFDDIDNAFFPILNSTLDDRIMAYVRAHAGDFQFNGIVLRPKGFGFD